MAKKKVTHHKEEEKITGKQQLENQAPATETMAMDETSEKLESLKCLNAMLLKETVERRQLVDSLMQSKGSLESELTRSNSENEVLRSELARLDEKASLLDLERSVVVVFVAVQICQQAEVIERERDGFEIEKAEIEKKLQDLEGEMGEILREKSEIEMVNSEKESEIKSLNNKLNELVLEIGNVKDFSNGVCRERDETRAKLDIQIAEAKELRGKLIEVEKKEKRIQQVVEKLRAEYAGVVDEKQERERRIESILEDKNLVETCLMDSEKLIEKMKREIEVIVKENKGMELERDLELTKRIELENTVCGLNEMVSNYRKEEERLRISVAEWEKWFFEGLEKEKEMGKEIYELVKEKNEREQKLEKLIEGNGLMEKDLDEALKQLNEHKLIMEQIVNEKGELAEDKVMKESEIVQLEKQVAGLRNVITGMEESCRAQKDKIQNLESEVSHYKDAFERVVIERDECRRGFNEEKQNSVSLKKKILKMEKNDEETLQAVEKMKAENIMVTGEKKDLESYCNMLKREIASLENELTEAQKELDAMQGKIKQADSNSELVLKVLRNTAESVCSKDERHVSGVDKQMNEEIEPCVAELEAIKNAFKSKESKMEDMKSQIEFLQNSVAAAHKKKSFWTVVSSATTLFAAVSLAYVARGH